jgi:hypothetical protein
VSVDAFALPVVIGQKMRGIKRELFGDEHNVCEKC